MKKFALFLTLILLSTNCSAYADVLGTHISSKKTELAQGTVLNENVFSDPSVGNQTEHYVEYSPNSYVYPAIAGGWSVYGKRTLTKADDILREKGFNPAMGMNADFFSFQTGVPMSNTISDGKVLTKDSSWQWGIGFRADGTAFAARFPISTTITATDGSCFTVECINKYRQPYALYLFTDEFSDSTHSPGWGRDVVLSNVSGDIRLGESITAVVEDISDNDGSVTIPNGKMVLSVSADASQELKDRLNCLTVGQTITITTSAAENEDLWNTAQYGIGCTGGKLITNRQLDFEDESAAPRSAVGIKADGSIIFYTIDGRQQGYSYGVRKETLARRLLELGCTEAINLDGGGSTMMGAVMPGTTSFNIINSPSDGGQRSVSNFLFLIKTLHPTGVPYKLVLDNYGVKLLSGASVDVSVIKAYDSSYGPADLPDVIEYYIEDDVDTAASDGARSSVNQDGYATVYGNGDIYIGAKSGDATGSTMISSVATPDSISVFNADNGYEISELVMEPGTSVSLSAESFFYGEKLISDNSCYRFTVISNDEPVGTIESNGVFHASGISGATGKLVVSAGICAVEIPIIIRDGGTDSANTNYPYIEGNIDNGILTAYVTSADITADNIRVTVDSKPIAFNYDENTYMLRCDVDNDGKYHRVGIFIAANNGVSSMWFCDSGNIDSIKNKFSDTEGHWASSYISYLASNGIVNGSLEADDQILFNPQKNMTRTEFAIMLCNYLGINPDDYAEVELPFIDNSSIQWWAENYVKAIYSLGIMQGQLGEYGVSFNPTANINRMEFAISLNRLLPNGLNSEPINAIDKDDIPFWAEESMRIIVTQGVMSGYPDGSLRPLQSVTRAEAVKMLYNIFGA